MPIYHHYHLLLNDNRTMDTAMFLFSNNEHLHFQERSIYIYIYAPLLSHTSTVLGYLFYTATH